MKLKTAIGGTLRDIRLRKHLTMRDLSNKSFVSLGHLSEIERGIKSASPEMLESIALGLSMTTAELIGEIYNYLEEMN
jgi:transcriptional regulator with XRE-family HTH domain